ncbi:MAG: glycine--tRNA ligase subunit beta [Acidobacteriota bacterium]
MSLEFILEVGCEEIPARFAEALLTQLKTRVSSMLEEARLSPSPVHGFVTPRRLVIQVAGIADSQGVQRNTVTGPPYQVAFDSAGKPSKAAEGFARKYGIPVEQLSTIETEKGRYLGFVQEIAGEPARGILSREVPSILASLELPKSMRWEPSQFSFIRPIRWILCLLGGDVVPMRLAGIHSGSESYGHRILSNDTRFNVDSFQSYRQSLVKFNVCLDAGERRQRILLQLEQRAQDQGGVLVSDPDLLNTVVHLNEQPSVVAGSFEREFLELPREVLVTVMREHQKYFSIQGEQGELLPKFLSVVDSDDQHLPTIRRGHERVLRARLADARFFWDSDLKVPFDSRSELLKRIVFQERMGTLFDKAKRIRSLAETVARMAKHPDLIENLSAAAQLCKNDLTTEMVREFTDLQGVMGGLYLRAQGFSPTVSQAVHDHYRPISLEDKVPETLEGAILSLADKLDSVLGAFSLGMIPTGSRDPLALRRQTLGIIKVLHEKNIDISLEKISISCHRLLKKWVTKSFPECYGEFQSFFRERFKFYLREQGFRYDEINAVVDVSVDNPLERILVLKSLSGIRGTEGFESLATSFKRVKNIIAKSGASMSDLAPPDPSRFEADEEKVLFERIEWVRPRVRKAFKSRNFWKAFELVASLRPQVDAFFDKVLVMAEDPLIQRNRLGLLAGLLETFLGLADISEIVISAPTST